MVKRKTKSYQFSVRITSTMKAILLRKMGKTGFGSISEYVRHLVFNDVEGYEGFYGEDTNANTEAE
jgi:hypothetical protein